MSGRASSVRSALSAVRSRLVQSDGVTITEMLVVVAILAIVLVGMTSLFVSASNSQVDQQNRFEAQQNARLALDSLRREIHCATAITPETMPSASISLTLGRHCPNAGTKLMSALTILTGGLVNGTVSVADTSPFPTPSVASPLKIYVGTSGGTITCENGNATSFTFCDGGLASTHAVGTKVAATTTVTWCTKDGADAVPPAAANPPYSLWRYRGTACGGTGRKWADFLTETTAGPAVSAGQVFTGYTTLTTGELRALTIALPVDASPDDTLQRYILRDDITLRNSPRS